MLIWWKETFFRKFLLNLNIYKFDHYLITLSLLVNCMFVFRDLTRVPGYYWLHTTGMPRNVLTITLPNSPEMTWNLRTWTNLWMPKPCSEPKSHKVHKIVFFLYAPLVWLTFLSGSNILIMNWLKLSMKTYLWIWGTNLSAKYGVSFCIVGHVLSENQRACTVQCEITGNNFNL